MKKDLVTEIRGLLTSERVLSLGVLRDGNPYVGLLPYALLPDYSAAIVHASRLALHSAGLDDGAPFSALVHSPDEAGGDPLQIRRVTLEGTVSRIRRDTRDYSVLRDLYVHRFPGSVRTFELADFELYRLTFAGGRYVGGFARARTLGPKDIRELGDMQ